MSKEARKKGHITPTAMAMRHHRPTGTPLLGTTHCLCLHTRLCALCHHPDEQQESEGSILRECRRTIDSDIRHADQSNTILPAQSRSNCEIDRDN